MKVFTCKNFTGYWPVGTSAVIVAKSKAEAAVLLQSKLSSIGLPQTIEENELEEVNTKESNVVILSDGNY